MQCQELVSHILTSLSSPADARNFPLAPKLIDLIASEWEGPLGSSINETEQLPLLGTKYRQSEYLYFLDICPKGLIMLPNYRL